MASDDAGSESHVGTGGGSVDATTDVSSRNIDATTDLNGEGVDASTDGRVGSLDAIADVNGASPDAASDGKLDSNPDANAPPSSVDAAGDAARCDKVACPAGCCNTNGVCEPGTTINQCGSGGAPCQSCLPQGRRGVAGASCDSQQCTSPPPCACSTGCCDSLGACQPGTSNTQCGLAAACQDCTASGLECIFQTCSFSTLDGGVCNAQTCPSGCCDLNGNCQQGLTDIVCGNFAGNCLNCAASGGVCSNQKCAAGSAAAACESSCAGCCDALGNCSAGTADTQCGRAGERCADCSTLGGQCQSSACVAPDGGSTCFDTCDGCCDTLGNCQLGFLDAQCSSGFSGGPCQDCTRLTPPSTCDINARACVGQQTICPAAYAGCPAALVEAAPPRQHVCSMNDLENAAVTCAGGLETFACFQFQMTPGPCMSCLQNVLFGPLSYAGPGRLQSDTLVGGRRPMQAAIRSCAAPFVDAACNHNSACVADCLTESCYHCSPDGTQCETQAQSGTCAAYLAADSCITQALSGPAAFCNPDTYQGNVGAWLQAVGAQYCGQ